MAIQVSYVVLYTQCLRYNICSAWFLDIRISTCFSEDKLYQILQVHARVCEENSEENNKE